MTEVEQILDEFWKRNTVPVTWLAEVLGDMEQRILGEEPSVTVPEGDVASDSVYADEVKEGLVWSSISMNEKKTTLNNLFMRLQ